jgi:hypothetical protein
MIMSLQSPFFKNIFTHLHFLSSLMKTLQDPKGCPHEPITRACPSTQKTRFLQTEKAGGAFLYKNGDMLPGSHVPKR